METSEQQQQQQQKQQHQHATVGINPTASTIDVQSTRTKKRKIQQEQHERGNAQKIESIDNDVINSNEEEKLLGQDGQGGVTTCNIASNLQHVIDCLLSIKSHTNSNNHDILLNALVQATNQLIANNEYKTIITPFLFFRAFRGLFNEIADLFKEILAMLGEIINVQKVMEFKDTSIPISDIKDMMSVYDIRSKFYEYKFKIDDCDQQFRRYGLEIYSYESHSKQDCYYFQSLNNVFHAVALTGININAIGTFSRENVDIEKQLQYYKTTVTAALDDNNEIALGNSSNHSQQSTNCKSDSDSSHSLQSTKSNNNRIVIDIFGHTGSEMRMKLAHLMPQSANCSTYWYPIVPWVLPMLHINDQKGSEKQMWDILQKCIHGSKSKNGEITANTGIKNFQSNTVRFHDHELYYDVFHNLLIIPILSPEEVRNWNGEAYSAIVLAGSYSNSDTANNVYRSVGALEKCLHGRAETFLATLDEVRLATALLALFVECLAGTLESFSNEFNQVIEDELYNIATQTKEEINATEIKETLLLIKTMYEFGKDAVLVATELENLRRNRKCRNFKTIVLDVVREDESFDVKFEEMVKMALEKMVYGDFFPKEFVYPKLNMSNVICLIGNLVSIRKVTFCSAVDSQNKTQHVAPDPILLTAKAASNWLRRHNIQILPGFDEKVNDNEDDDDNSYECTLEEEYLARGWALPDNEPRIDEVVLMEHEDDDSVSAPAEDFTDDEQGK